jgi:hypothetical protein
VSHLLLLDDAGLTSALLLSYEQEVGMQKYVISYMRPFSLFLR